MDLSDLCEQHFFSLVKYYSWSCCPNPPYIQILAPVLFFLVRVRSVCWLRKPVNLLLIAISSRARRISWEPYTLKGVKSENEVYALLRSTTFLLHATLITTLSPIYRHSHLHCKIDVVVDLFDESISPRNMPTQNKKNISLSQCKKSTASYQGNNKRTQ